MFGRLMVLLAAAVVVAGLAMLPELANPASGAPVVTRAGTVVPTSLTAGGQARFCGSGFAPGAAVTVLVSDRRADAVRANPSGGFCVDMRATAAASGPSRLLAVGPTPEGGLLKVTGGVAITGSEALRDVAAPTQGPGPLMSSSSPLVLELWAGAAALGLLAGAVAISAQRRRHATAAVE